MFLVSGGENFGINGTVDSFSETNEEKNEDKKENE